MSTLNTSAAQPITDVHAHVLLPSLQAEVESRDPDGAREAAALELSRNGAVSLAVSGPMVGARIPRLTDVNVRLGSMDEQGVDRQWVSPSPSHFYPWAGEQLAVPAGSDPAGILVGNPGGALEVSWETVSASRFRRQPNHDELVAALTRMVVERDLWAARRDRMAQEASERFDPQRCLDRHAEVLREAASAARATG